jgi:hypothetical protein
VRPKGCFTHSAATISGKGFRLARIAQLLAVAMLPFFTIGRSALANQARPAGQQEPLTIELVNQAGDLPGLWDAKIRARAAEALIRNANDVSRYWMDGRPVKVEIGTPAPFRLIAVNRPLDYAGTPASGYHDRDGHGPYGIVNLGSAHGNVVMVYLLLSHELAEAMVNPHLDRALNGYELEVVDPAVCCSYEISLRDGTRVRLNTFVLPHWFTGGPGPYTYPPTQYIKAPLQTGPGGFKSPY